MKVSPLQRRLAISRGAPARSGHEWFFGSAGNKK
jgi:hypothetical protein